MICQPSLLLQFSYRITASFELLSGIIFSALHKPYCFRAVGAGSEAAKKLTDFCVDFVGGKFADWIIGQGGWMSVVEDSSSNSELD